MDIPSDVAAAALGADAGELGLTVAAAGRELVPLADALRLTLADIQLFPVAKATPQERADLVALRNEVEAVAKVASVWVDAIDLAIRRAAEELGGAKQIPMTGGVIMVEPQRDDVKVDVGGLKKALEELAAMPGAQITPDEVAAIFTTTVEVKADGTKLNYYARNRGEDVAEAIESHRKRTPASPLSARLRFVERAEEG